MEFPNYQVVARFLRRMAPIQTHENRRHFQRAAELLEGPKITDDNLCVLYSLPVNVNEQIKGFVEIHTSAAGVEVAFRDYSDKILDAHQLVRFEEEEIHREMSEEARLIDQGDQHG